MPKQDIGVVRCYNNFWYRYLTKETIVRERVQSTFEATGDNTTAFIDLFVCPTYTAAYKDTVLVSYGIDKANYRSGGYYTAQNNSDRRPLRRIFDSITYSPRELLHKIQILTLDRKQDQIVVDFGQKNIKQDLKITTKYWSTYGKCYSIQPKQRILDLGVQTIDIVARVDIYLYFGYPGQFMFNTKTKVRINLVLE